MKKQLTGFGDCDKLRAQRNGGLSVGAAETILL